MFSRPGASVGLLVLLLASTTLLPLAASDHAYSHRYVIYGRVVDADGNAVPGLAVSLTTRDVETEGACADQPGTDTEAFGRTMDRRVTNPYGEFMFCRHVHSMARSLPGTATIVLEGANNHTTEVRLDPYYRVSFVPITLPEVRTDANADSLSKEYTVIGRLWREGNARTHVEGIRVFGETLDNAPVNVTLEMPGAEPIRVNTTTNNYGDFAVRVPVSARPTAGSVVIEVENRTYRQDVDPKVGTTAFKTEIPAESSFGVSRTTLYAVIGVVAAAAIVAAAVIGFRRAAARREEDAVRSRTERRRANK